MRHNSLHAAVRAAMARDLSAAIKTDNRNCVNALRGALGALDNATAVPLTQSPQQAGSYDVTRRELARADIEAVLMAEARERFSAAAEYERLGHCDHAARLRHEAAIVRGCLERIAADDNPEAR